MQRTLDDYSIKITIGERCCRVRAAVVRREEFVPNAKDCNFAARYVRDDRIPRFNRRGFARPVPFLAHCSHIAREAGSCDSALYTIKLHDTQRLAQWRLNTSIR